MKQNYVTITKTFDDNNIKHISLLILKISFLTLFGCWVKITPLFNPICGQIDRPCPNDFKNIGQSWRDRQTDRDYEQSAKRTYKKIGDIF